MLRTLQEGASESCALGLHSGSLQSGSVRTGHKLGMRAEFSCGKVQREHGQQQLVTGFWPGGVFHSGCAGEEETVWRAGNLLGFVFA